MYFMCATKIKLHYNTIFVGTKDDSGKDKVKINKTKVFVIECLNVKRRDDYFVRECLKKDDSAFTKITSSPRFGRI